MVAARPLGSTDDVDDGLDVTPLDDLSELRPEVRAAIEQAEARIQAGTARLVPHGQVQDALAEIGRHRGR